MEGEIHDVGRDWKQITGWREGRYNGVGRRRGSCGGDGCGICERGRYEPWVRGEWTREH